MSSSHAHPAEFSLPGSGELERLFDLAPVGLCYLDTELRFLFINEWLARINGLPAADHIGRAFAELLHDVASGAVPQLQQVLRSAEPVIDGEVLAETPAHPGERRCYRHSYYPDIGAAGQVIGVCCVVQDVTARKQAETELAERNRELEGANVRMAKIVADFGQTNEALKREALAAAEARARLEKAKKALQRLALYDTLTGIGNRELFSRQFERLLEIAASRNEELALLAMDLDGFKDVNDRLGHAAGDEVLREFAARLGQTLQPGDRKYRLGGDEFAVLLSPRFGAFDSAVAVAQEIAGRASSPLTIRGHSCSIGVSIGIAVYPDHGRESGVLLRKADAAMYEAKKKHQVLAGASELGATTVLRKLRTGA